MDAQFYEQIALEEMKKRIGRLNLVLYTTDILQIINDLHKEGSCDAFKLPNGKYYITEAGIKEITDQFLDKYYGNGIKGNLEKIFLREKVNDIVEQITSSYPDIFISECGIEKKLEEINKELKDIEVLEEGLNGSKDKISNNSAKIKLGKKLLYLGAIISVAGGSFALADYMDDGKINNSLFKQTNKKPEDEIIYENLKFLEEENVNIPYIPPVSKNLFIVYSKLYTQGKTRIPIDRGISDKDFLNAVKNQEWYQKDLQDDGKINNPETFKRFELYEKLYKCFKDFGFNELEARYSVLQAIDPPNPKGKEKFKDIENLNKWIEYKCQRTEMILKSKEPIPPEEEKIIRKYLKFLEKENINISEFETGVDMRLFYNKLFKNKKIKVPIYNTDISDKGIINAIRRQEWYQKDLQDDGKINNKDSIKRMKLFNKYYFCIRKLGETPYEARAKTFLLIDQPTSEGKKALDTVEKVKAYVRRTCWKAMQNK